MAVWNVLRIDPAFWKHAFWDNLRLARQAQAHGAMQKVRELAPLIALLRRRPPKVVVEIGTARGGTFYAWCKVAKSDAVIVSIDLPGGRFGGGYTGEDSAVLRRYGQAPQHLHFVQGDSHDEQTKATLLEILKAKRIDFLMIDGDHSYEGVKRDFEMYAPLVTPGCPVAFHDILPHAADQGCEVDLFWNEIKDDYLHTEFIDPYCDSSGRRYGGIGVLYWATQSRSGTLRRLRGNR